MPSVSIEAPRQPEILELLRLGDELALSLYPAENYYGLAIDELDAPGVSVFVARVDGIAVGTAALVDRGDGSAELKRMFVLESARGRGIASLLLAALEEHALANAIGVIQLETGAPQPAAIALYEKHGYRHIANFGQYVDDPTSVCMEKQV